MRSGFGAFIALEAIAVGVIALSHRTTAKQYCPPSSAVARHSTPEHAAGAFEDPIAFSCAPRPTWATSWLRLTCSASTETFNLTAG
jgi:hypothetical protein